MLVDKLGGYPPDRCLIFFFFFSYFFSSSCISKRTDHIKCDTLLCLHVEICFDVLHSTWKRSPHQSDFTPRDALKSRRSRSMLKFLFFCLSPLLFRYFSLCFFCFCARLVGSFPSVDLRPLPFFFLLHVELETFFCFDRRTSSLLMFSFFF